MTRRTTASRSAGPGLRSRGRERRSTPRPSISCCRTRSRVLAELAERAGVSRATINRIEQGHAESLTFETVNRLAKALEVDADVLVTFEK